MSFVYNDFCRETVQLNERGLTRRFFFNADGNPLQMRRAQLFCIGLLAATYTLHSVASADVVMSSPLSRWVVAKQDTVPAAARAQPLAALRTPHTDSELKLASHDARHMRDWIVQSGDNGTRPFAIVDKKAARVFVFYADGRLRGTAPALLDLAVGDEAVPGIGDRPLASIRPNERTTPAGRFVVAMDRNLKGSEILWVDYDGAISMHAVATNKAKERRLQRLNSATPLDNRISYGCINVPPKFFKMVVRPTFTGAEGIVYVLPDTKSLKDVFTSYTEVSSNTEATAPH